MHKANQYISIAIKCLVSLLLLWAIYLVFKDRAFDWELLLQQLDHLHIGILVLVIVLSLGSWAVESFKWKYVCRDYWVLRFRESVLLNLLAQSASFFTPLRSGEFSVKCLYAPKDARKKTLLRVAEANVAQMTVTSIMGVLGLIYYHKLIWQEFEQLGRVHSTVLLITGLSILVLFIALIIWQKQRIKAFFIAATDLGLLLFCFGRYLLFSHVWIVLLTVMGSSADYIETSLMVWLFYLLISILPIFQLLDIIVKLGASVLLFRHLGLSVEQISAVTALAWLTNSLLPSLLGAVSVPFVKKSSH